MKMGHMRHGTVVDSNTTVGCYIAKPWGCAPDERVGHTRIAGCEILTFHAISRSRLIQATLAEAGGQPMGETMES